MSPFLRTLTALALAAVLLPSARAQDDRGDERDAGEDEEIVIRRDGVVIFRNGDGDVRRFEFDGVRPFVADTVIDGRRTIRFRTPDGDEQTFEFEVPAPEDFEHLRELERFRFEEFDHDFDFDFDGERPEGLLRFGHDGVPFGAARAAERALRLEHLRGATRETRREMRELGRRARELAERYREAEGRERAEAERELDEALERLFEVRGRARAEAADRLDEQADRLREEADALREALREREQRRRALIEERKRELTGERGSDW